MAIDRERIGAEAQRFAEDLEETYGEGAEVKLLMMVAMVLREDGTLASSRACDPPGADAVTVGVLRAAANDMMDAWREREGRS